MDGHAIPAWTACRRRAKMRRMPRSVCAPASIAALVREQRYRRPFLDAARAGRLDEIGALLDAIRAQLGAVERALARETGWPEAS